MTTFADRLAAELTEGWAIKARANQLPPDGDWSVWLLLAGRGFGKTRVLSEMANSWAASKRCGRMALVAATAGVAGLVAGADAIVGTGALPLFAVGHRKNATAKLISRAPKPITPTNTKRMDVPLGQMPLRRC